MGRMLPEVGELYRDHAASVWRYARARLPSDADAEDVTSEVFARAMRSPATFDPARGTPRAWLMGVAHHTVADWWRRRRPEDPSPSPPERADDAGPERALLRDEGVGELRAVLDVLSEREREALSLRFAAELPSDQIGAVLGISPTAARMLVHRAVTKLRGVMTGG